MQGVAEKYVRNFRWQISKERLLRNTDGKNIVRCIAIWFCQHSNENSTFLKGEKFVISRKVIRLPYWGNWHCIYQARCSSVYVCTSDIRYPCHHLAPFQWVPPHQTASSWGVGGFYSCASYRCRRHPRPVPRRWAPSLWSWRVAARWALGIPKPAGCHRNVLSCCDGDVVRWTPHGRGVARTGAGWRTTPPSRHVGVINPCSLCSSARHIRCSS